MTPSPNQGTGYNQFASVSCAGPTWCMAVGVYDLVYNGIRIADQTLIENWNGSTWQIVSSPNQGFLNNQLEGVSCTSLTWCMAVGSYFDPVTGMYQTLIENWNGSNWTISPSPGQAELFAVSCTSSTNCAAVGEINESWNGTAWSIVPSPTPSSSNYNLSGVSCTNSTSCMAVGYYDNASLTSQTLIESWNGSTWTVVPSPNLGSFNNVLSGVSCTTPTNCVAVGHYISASDVLQTLIETWNASSWSVTSSPNSSGNSQLLGVSCTKLTKCVAVGDYSFGTLIESWKRTGWLVTPSPNQGSSDSLSSVSCTRPKRCVAVGYGINALTATDQTLIETGSRPPR